MKVLLLRGRCNVSSFRDITGSTPTVTSRVKRSREANQAEVTKLPVRGTIYASFSDIEYRIRSYGKMVEVTSTVVPLAAR